jgi:phosphoglycerate dehydrogenase-like enzyme
VAEHTFALLLALLRQVPRGDRSVREHRWSERRALGGAECAGKVLGVIGAGHIGRRVAQIGAAFGMRVMLFSPSASSFESAVEVCGSLADLLRVADVVSIHTSLRPDTRGLLGAPQLALMKPDAYLINTSRGPVVDQDALVAALRDGKLAGAALDVFAVEPPSPDDPLLALDNVVLSPHVAWFTREARQRARDTIVAQVEAITRGDVPLHVVNPATIGEWRRRYAPGL